MKNRKKMMIVTGVVLSCLALFVSIGIFIKSGRTKNADCNENCGDLLFEYHYFCQHCGMDLTAAYGGVTDEAEAHLAECGSVYCSLPVYDPYAEAKEPVSQEDWKEHITFNCVVESGM